MGFSGVWGRKRGVSGGLGYKKGGVLKDFP